MGLRKIGRGGVDWIGLSQDSDQWMALVNTVMNPWVPENACKLFDGCTTGGLSSSAEFHIPYILESNPHLVFATFLNEKKLIRASNPHLSFNRPLPV
jgi:hypothetical protein